MDEYDKAVKFWSRVYIGLYFVFPFSTFVFYFLFELLFGGDLIVSVIRNFYRSIKSDPLSVLILIPLLFCSWFMYKIAIDDRTERLRYRYHRCHKCGYDMTKCTSEECSECGHRVDPLDTWWYEITEEKRRK